MNKTEEIKIFNNSNDACKDALDQAGLTPYCNENPYGIQHHCADFQSSYVYQQTCRQKGPMAPVLALACINKNTGEMKFFSPDTLFQECNKLNAQDSAWQGGPCFCCCYCFANDTLIVIPDGTEVIQQILIGQDIVTASLPQGPGSTNLEISKAKVEFSRGTGQGGIQPIMIYLVYGENAQYEAICSPNQPFLLDTGKFCRADRLVPNKTNLVDQNGKSLPLKMVAIGEYKGGVHHISTDVPWQDSPDNHLIIANNAVAGDYTLQSKFTELSDKWKVDNHDELAVIGEESYIQQNKTYISDTTYSLVFTSITNNSKPYSTDSTGNFKAYATSRGTQQRLEQNSSARFLTEQQAQDVLNNGKQIPLSSSIPWFNIIKKQFTGFYPDIEFLYDPLDFIPNVYSYYYYGKKIVLVTGGLVRTVGFYYEGLAMAMAQGIGAFEGGTPVSAFGYSGVGVADFYAFAAVSRDIWPLATPWFNYSTGAMKQWKNLFNLVSLKNAEGNPQDPINNPSLACRYQTVQNAIAGGNLPECAGGEPLPKFNLVQAQSNSLSNIQLTFNIGLTNSAEDISNYILDPILTIASAKVNPQKNFIIDLTTKDKLEPKKEYRIIVSKDLQSYLGNYIDPDHNSVTFTTGK